MISRPFLPNGPIDQMNQIAQSHLLGLDEQERQGLFDPSSITSRNFWMNLIGRQMRDPKVMNGYGIYSPDESPTLASTLFQWFDLGSNEQQIGISPFRIGGPNQNIAHALYQGPQFNTLYYVSCMDLSRRMGRNMIRPQQVINSIKNQAFQIIERTPLNTKREKLLIDLGNGIQAFFTIVNPFDATLWDGFCDKSEDLLNWYIVNAAGLNDIASNLISRGLPLVPPRMSQSQIQKSQRGFAESQRTLLKLWE